MISTVTERLNSLHGQRAAATNHNATHSTESAQHGLIIGNGTERSNTGQLKPQTAKFAGTRTIGKQQARITNLLSTPKLDGMLTRLYTDHAFRQKADILLLVKTAWACPQLVFAHTPRQIVLEG